MLCYCDQRLLCGYCDVLVKWILTFVMTGVQISPTQKLIDDDNEVKLLLKNIMHL